MLPGKSGFDVISEMREAGQFVPTLMLTARGHADDVLQGFAAGADDYLTKPFELSILIARIRGLLRRREWLRAAGASPVEPLSRSRWNRSDAFTFGEKSVDFDRLELRVREQVFPLTLMEANVLRYLIENEGKGGFPQGHARERLGPARGHRHPRHRQFHRAPAPLHRGRSHPSAASANRARRGVPVRGVARRIARPIPPSFQPKHSKRLTFYCRVWPQPNRSVSPTKGGFQ